MYADLRDADLRGADLTHQVELSGADFRAAELGSADLSGAKLRGTDFRGASLFRVNFSGAQFSDTDLTKAAVGFTLFSDVDLSEAKGLGEVKHLGPSSLGIDTIYRSKGKIPESFLRGAGVSDDFVTYAKSLVANPIQFYSCFISYSTKDQAFADRLYADLQNKGVRCWFAPHNIKAGLKLHEQIAEAIRLHDKLLLILSPHSMESEWVKTEIAKARKREVPDPRAL